jgi:Ca2+-binding RTX toxin-like protein
VNPISRSACVALGALALGAAGLVLPAPAVAADTPTIVEVGDGYHLSGGAGNNDIVLSIVDGRILVRDQAASGFAQVGTNCNTVPIDTGAAVSCKLKSPTVFHADLGDGDDSFDSTAAPALVRIDVRTGEGSNIVAGGPGNDVIRGQSTALSYDRFSGGAGNDRLTAGDTIALMQGDDGNDIFVGGPSNDQVSGGNGDDYVRTGGGQDVISGGDGNDGLSGDGGNDAIRSGPGNDHLYGGDGDDDLVGGLGRDTYAGQAGNDVLRARDNERDSVNCGGGDDTATVDLPVVFLLFTIGGDTVAQCEQTVTTGPLDPQE